MAGQIHHVFRPNLCTCGHDLVNHKLTTNPQTCLLCVKSSGGVNNQHDFTSDNEAYPSTPFPQSEPRGYVCAGGLGSAFALTTGPANSTGATTVNFLASVDRVKPGMTFMTQPAKSAQNAVYRVVGVNYGGTSITIAEPGLLRNTASINCLFWGDTGSMMGPGRPANGQRAG